MNCGNVLADKWLYYQERLKELRGTSKPKPIDMGGNEVPDTAECKVLQELTLKRYCFRRHMLTHLDLIDQI